jgi:hypothetical protein
LPSHVSVGRRSGLAGCLSAGGFPVGRFS